MSELINSTDLIRYFNKIATVIKSKLIYINSLFNLQNVCIKFSKQQIATESPTLPNKFFISFAIYAYSCPTLPQRRKSINKIISKKICFPCFFFFCYRKICKIGRKSCISYALTHMKAVLHCASFSFLAAAFLLPADYF